MSERKRRLLIAEDNPALARVVQFNLEKSGFEVTVAANGRIAWERAASEQFDAVITDQQMPEMTGMELCTKLRTLPHYAQTPIVLLTAKCLELDLPSLSSEFNISACIRKPFSPTKVVKTVTTLLAV